MPLKRPVISEATRQILKITAGLVVVYMLVALLIYLIEKDGEGASITTYSKALWYALVTVSTVGYGDLYPISDAGRILGGVIIIISVGFIGFVVSKFSELAAEHSRRKFLGMDGTDFSGHYIVVGWSDISRIVIKEVMAAGFKVAVLTNEEKDILEMKSIFSDPKTFFVTFGLSEDGATFERLNIDEAVGAILLTGDDAITLVTVLELKRVNPELHVTAYIQNSQLKKTVQNAGVSYVISPNEVVGRMIASATFEPDVSLFLEDILSTTVSDDDMDIQEFRLVESHELVGVSFRKAAEALEQRADAKLLSYSRRSNGEWILAKGNLASESLRADDYVILLANQEASRKLSTYFGVPQGRRS